MKLIDKSNFLSTICVVFTCLVLGKIVVEAVFGGIFGNDQENLLLMFGFSALGTFVLSQHYRLERFPLIAVMAGQYVVLIAAVMLVIWISGFFVELHEDAYRDMFWSFTVPYAIAAAVYYISLYFEIKKANRLLQEVRETGAAK